MQVTGFDTHLWFVVSQDETGQDRTEACAVTPPPLRQSKSVQHAPHTPLQQNGAEPAHVDVNTHLCVLTSHVSVVHALLSLQSVSFEH